MAAAGISCLLDNASLSFQFKAIESIFCIIQTQTESIRRQTIGLVYAYRKLPPYIEKGGVVAEGGRETEGECANSSTINVLQYVIVYISTKIDLVFR